MSMLSCNIFKSLDPPKKPYEILEAARVAFDKNNYTSAQQYYQQLEGTPYAQTAAAEQVFVFLAQLGLDLYFFTTIFDQKTTDPGTLITAFANQLAPYADESTRLHIFNIYQNTNTLTDQQIRQFLQMVLSFVLTAEIFSEAILSQNTLRQSDLVAHPSLCIQINPNDPPADDLSFLTNCARPSQSILIAGTTLIPSLTDTNPSLLSGQPSLTMVNAALNTLLSSIFSINKLSTIANNFQTLSTQLNKINLLNPEEEVLYRALLIKNNIGAPS